MKVLHFVSHFSLRSETFIYDEVNSLERAFPNSNTVLTFERQLEAERPHHRVVALNQPLSLAQKLRRRQLKIFKGVRISREFFPLCSYLDQHLGSFDILQAHFG